jgi:[ribosomal protein S5]-alanine N-acetyltransferase
MEIYKLERTTAEPALPEMCTRNMILRPLRIEYAKAIERITTEKVLKYMPEIAADFDARKFIQRAIDRIDSYMEHVIIKKDTKEIIGYVELPQEPGDEDYEIRAGYWIGEAYQGQGFCTEVLKYITRIVDHNKWTKPVIAHVHKGNLASGKVLLKCGFVKDEGLKETKYGDVSVFKYYANV